MQRFLLFSLSVVCLPVYALAQVQALTITTSEVGFEIRNFGLTVEGKFSGLIGAITFNPENLQQSKVDVSIDASSINTGIALRDNHLTKEEYLDTKDFSHIKLVSTEIVRREGNTYILSGNLTIKGVTKSVSIIFFAHETSKGFLFKGNFSINRIDYGVGGKSMSMADTVRILFTLYTEG